jgi:hypothetical protein
MSKSVKTVLGVIAIALLAAPVFAENEETITDALKNGKVKADLRLRYETVDQADAFPGQFDGSAKALTFRTRLGYQTGSWYNLAAYVEFQANTAVGIDDYNSTANGMGEYPVIADPEDESIGQAYLDWKVAGHTTVRAGRQRIKLDNDRFIGNVGFRQLEQTYDGVAVITSPTDNFAGVFAHITNTNRIFGEHNPSGSGDLHTDAEVLNVSYKTAPGKITLYGYFVDLPDADTASNQTIGVRFDGKTGLSDGFKLLYTAEWAQQSDYSGGSSLIDADYTHAVLGLGMKKLTVKVGYEVLGSNDGLFGFSTPLATLHAHNGWADKFLNTPADGLQDTYIALSSKLNGFVLKAIYHDFSADFGGDDHGSEIDLLVARKFAKHYNWSVKFADYSADDHATDTTKIWGTVGAKF